MEGYLSFILVLIALSFYLGYLFAGEKKNKGQEEDTAEKDFSHAVIHELRAYLTNLGWIFEKLLDKGLASYSDDQYKAISLGRSTVENANNLINDTLNAISLGRSEPRYKFKLNDINKVLEDILAEYKMIAAERRLELSFERSHLPIPLFFFDGSQMYLALHDLVHNSMKYTPNGGKITVRTELVDNKVRITVSDTGIGIPDSQKDKIFSKFFRADNARKVLGDGSGLGLYITKSIVTRHNGEIRLQSEENKGTTVEITLPLKQTEPK